MSDFDEWVPADGQADVVESKPDPDQPATARTSDWRRWGVPVGLLGAGALVGGVLAASLSANAAPSPSPSPSYGNGAPLPGEQGPHGQFHGGFHGLDHTGTVTAVGASSVTIKESAGTTAYAVNANSDIDKNGEGKLSDLKAGDAVRFNVVTVDGKKTIGVLHSGNEELNRPHHGSGPGMPGDAGTPGGPTTENSNAGFTNA